MVSEVRGPRLAARRSPGAEKAAESTARPGSAIGEAVLASRPLEMRDTLACALPPFSTRSAACLGAGSSSSLSLSGEFAGPLRKQECTENSILG